MPISSREILDDERMKLTLTDGRVVVLVFQDTMERVIVTENGEQCGEFEFAVRDDGARPGESFQVARLRRAYNERFPGHGVGTEAVKWFLFQQGVEPGALELPDNDGHRREDGGHLTGDGPAFVESLKRKLRDGKLQADYDGI